MERDGIFIFEAPHPDRPLALIDLLPDEWTEEPLASFFTAKLKRHGGKRGARRKRQ